MSIGFGPLMTVDGIRGGGGTTVGSSVSTSVGWAAAMSSEVIERAWLSTDTGVDDIVKRGKGRGA